MKKHQQGLSLISMIWFIIFLGIGLIYGSQIGLGYFEQHTLREAVTAALAEMKNNDNANPKKIKQLIATKVSMNTIDLKEDDIIVEREAKGFKVTIDYGKEIKVSDDIKLIMDLTIEEHTP